MIYKIFTQDADTLLELPETGMGYQIVQAKQYCRFQTRKFVVYNSNIAIEYDSDFLIYKRKIDNEGYRKVFNKVEEIMLETDTIRVISKSEIKQNSYLSYYKKNNYKRHSGNRGAIDNPKENADGLEIFIRVSAYEDDRRVDISNKRLKPGTFTTTKEDYRDCISSNDDPIDRYALPNNEKINWGFSIKPETIDNLQRGIVQPAFNHEGGGIESFFEGGTSKGTLIDKFEYGK